MRRPISSYNAVFCFVIVKLRRLARYFRWRFGGQRFALEFCGENLRYRVYKHQSVLIRRLGDTDLSLQHNKVENLKIAIRRLDGVIVRPGETFSFWRLVGFPSRRKGYVRAIMLSNGRAVAGGGGGLCQIANLLHWICLHSPLTVTQRQHHSFDPFPDDGRVVPFGSGATVFYNYVDYQFRNDTERVFQLRFWLDGKCINGDLRVDEELDFKYHVFEREHRFVRVGDEFYRRNELWRQKYLKKGSGEVVEVEMLYRNNSLLRYVPEGAVVGGGVLFEEDNESASV